MSNIQNINFSQVKVDEITKTLSEHLFKKFKIEKFLSKAGVIKARGIQISLMLCIMFYMSFKSKKSIRAGLTEFELTKHKNAYHRLLNEPYYDWRNFMLSTAKHYTEQHSADESEECCLIVDDTKKKKSELAIMMIKRAIKRNVKFDYVLWDSWYNSSDSFKFVYDVLLPKGKHLVSMVKKNDEKYYYKGKEMTIKQICKSIKKWKENEKGIKYKSATVGTINKSSKEREVIGAVKMCFYSFPGTKRKNFKTIISTNIELTEEGVLEKYTNRWSIEVAIKDLKQCIGEYLKCMLKHVVKHILEYARSLGYTDIDDLICVIEIIIDDFWVSGYYEEKIVEVGDKLNNQLRKPA